MISEIRGKISQSGSNLSDRLEDKLTGDFFGAIRYLPFEEGLKGVLSQVQFGNKKETSEWNKLLPLKLGYDVNYKFWPKHPKGEIDLLIEFNDVLIGIEVKYTSGISSEDELMEYEPINYEESVHQLSKYSHMLEELSGNRKVYLIFLSPYSTQRQVQQEFDIRYKISPNVSIGFANWEDLYTKLILMKETAKSKAQQLILTDVEQLLKVKRLVRFSGFTNKIFYQKIEYEPYVYQNDSAVICSSWIWRKNQIVEEQSYVFNIE